MQLADATVAAFHPERGTQGVIELDDVRFERDVVVRQPGLDLQPLAMEQHVGHELQQDVLHALVLLLTHDDLRRQDAAALLALEIKTVFSGHAAKVLPADEGMLKRGF